jgi:hypothetical protein
VSYQIICISCSNQTLSAARKSDGEIPPVSYSLNSETTGLSGDDGNRCFTDVILDRLESDEPRKNWVRACSITMILFEKEIYPAFTAGDSERITQALQTVIDKVVESTSDADTVFRLMNWSWPALTSKARVTSEDGIKITKQFTTLVTELMKTCSPSLMGQISNCKLVLRCVGRGLNAVAPEVATKYLDGIEKYILTQKGVRGFFLDKAAVDCLLTIESDDDTLTDTVNRVLEKILRNRRLFQQDQLIDFLVRVIKKRSCDAFSASLCSRVLASHNSPTMYDTLMDKLTFVQLSTEDSVLKRLIVLNFLIGIVGSICPGSRLPGSIHKTELSLPILNWQQNKLVALYTLRLTRGILNRLDDESMRDRLVELNTLVPVIKHIMTIENETQRKLFLCEIFSVIVGFKRAMPGSFQDCKFDWLKLLDESSDKSLVGQFVFDIYKDAVPVTAATLRMVTKLFQSGLGNIAMEWFDVDCVGGQLFGDGIKSVMLKHASEEMVSCVVNQVISHPEKIKEGIAAMVRDMNPELARKLDKKVNKKRKEPIVEIEAKRMRVSEPEYIDWGEIGQVTKSVNREVQSSVNLISLIGSEKLYKVILSLSSKIEAVRTAGFDALAIVLRALAMVIEAKGTWTARFVFREAPQVAMVLTWLRNGIKAPPEGESVPEPLPLVATVFAVEAIKVMFDPKSPLYRPVYKHVLERPSMNVYHDVPMWQSCFFSEDASNIVAYRLWLLEVVKTAARDPLTADILVRRGVICAIMDAAISLNATAEEVDLALSVVANFLLSASDPQVAQRFGIGQWILNISNSRHVKFLDDS